MGNSHGVIEFDGCRVIQRKQIAEGGFGYVSLVEDDKGKSYAMKRVIVPLDDVERNYAAKWEQDVLKNLPCHPNIVQFYGACQIEVSEKRQRHFCTLMEYCNGNVWEMMVEAKNRDEMLTEAKVCLIFRDACLAIHHLHTQVPPIAHRDLKVENLLFGLDGNIKLTDFGSCSTNHGIWDNSRDIAIKEEEISKNTTLAYRSPEQVDLYLKKRVCEKVDIWALGVLLFVLLTERSPFADSSGNVEKMGILNCRYRYTPIGVYSESFKKFIAYLLNPDPDERPSIHDVLSYADKLKQDGFLTDWPGLPKNFAIWPTSPTNSGASPSSSGSRRNSTGSGKHLGTTATASSSEKVNTQNDRLKGPSTNTSVQGSRRDNASGNNNQLRQSAEWKREAKASTATSPHRGNTSSRKENEQQQPPAGNTSIGWMGQSSPARLRKSTGPSKPTSTNSDIPENDQVQLHGGSNLKKDRRQSSSTTPTRHRLQEGSNNNSSNNNNNNSNNNNSSSSNNSNRLNALKAPAVALRGVIADSAKQVGEGLSSIINGVVTTTTTTRPEREAEVASWVVKATNNLPGFPKAKYIRFIVVALWESEISLDWLCIKFSERPWHTSSVISCKLLVVLLKIMQQGPPKILSKFITFMDLVSTIEKHWVLVSQNINHIVPSSSSSSSNYDNSNTMRKNSSSSSSGRNRNSLLSSGAASSYSESPSSSHTAEGSTTATHRRKLKGNGPSTGTFLCKFSALLKQKMRFHSFHSEFQSHFTTLASLTGKGTLPTDIATANIPGILSRLLTIQNALEATQKSIFSIDPLSDIDDALTPTIAESTTAQAALLPIVEESYIIFVASLHLLEILYQNHAASLSSRSDRNNISQASVNANAITVSTLEVLREQFDWQFATLIEFYMRCRGVSFVNSMNCIPDLPRANPLSRWSSSSSSSSSATSNRTDASRTTTSQFNQNNRQKDSQFNPGTVGSGSSSSNVGNPSGTYPNDKDAFSLHKWMPFIPSHSQNIGDVRNHFSTIEARQEGDIENETDDQFDPFSLYSQLPEPEQESVPVPVSPRRSESSNRFPPTGGTPPSPGNRQPALPVGHHHLQTPSQETQPPPLRPIAPSSSRSTDFPPQDYTTLAPNYSRKSESSLSGVSHHPSPSPPWPDNTSSATAGFQPFAEFPPANPVSYQAPPQHTEPSFPPQQWGVDTNNTTTTTTNTYSLTPSPQHDNRFLSTNLLDFQDIKISTPTPPTSAPPTPALHHHQISHSFSNPSFSNNNTTNNQSRNNSSDFQVNNWNQNNSTSSTLHYPQPDRRLSNNEIQSNNNIQNHNLVSDMNRNANNNNNNNNNYQNRDQSFTNFVDFDHFNNDFNNNNTTTNNNNNNNNNATADLSATRTTYSYPKSSFPDSPAAAIPAPDSWNNWTPAPPPPPVYNSPQFSMPVAASTADAQGGFDAFATTPFGIPVPTSLPTATTADSSQLWGVAGGRAIPHGNAGGAVVPTAPPPPTPTTSNPFGTVSITQPVIPVAPAPVAQLPSLNNQSDSIYCPTLQPWQDDILNNRSSDPGLRRTFEDSLSTFYAWGLDLPFSAFTVDCVIGTGAFAVVYKGSIKVAGVRVAIKKLLSTAGQTLTAKTLKDFVTEADFMRTLRHPNIVQMLATCTQPLSVVMEFCDKGNLMTVLLDETMELSLSLRLSMLRDIARGMAYLHSHNPVIMHRDLKSLNILITDRNVAKITDFGLSRLTNNSTENMQQMMTGQIGTYHWMAPEVISGTLYTPKADVYSFAIIAWELLTRQTPYLGMHPVQIVAAVCNTNLRPKIPDTVPAPMKWLVTRCWDAIESRRPSFAEIIKWLDELGDLG